MFLRPWRAYHCGYRGPARITAALALVLTALVALTATPHTAAGAAVRAVTRPSVTTLTQRQALAQAHRTGKPVLVTSATTQSSTLTANPNGTLTLTETSDPVRVFQAGKWEPVDATLRRDSDGTVYPAAAAGYLRLSGGGTGPIAVLRSAGHTVRVSLPGFRLPAPSLSGPTATYAGVLPGVDLEITADTTGGYSDVVVVKNASAARNPELMHLAFTLDGSGLRMRADTHGALSFSTARGHVVFAGPAPVMWDSRATTGRVRSAVSPVTGQRTDLRTGQPTTSSAAGPGEAARSAPVAVRASGDTVTDIPDTRLLTGPGVVYPVYIDPAMGSTLAYWAQVDTINTGEAYSKPSYMQVGYCSTAAPFDCYSSSGSSFTARSFVRESWPNILRNTDSASVTIYSSTLYLQDAWAPACDTSLGDFGVQVWRTGSVSSSTSWDNQPTWAAQQGSTKYFAYQNTQGTSCPENTVGFDVSEAAKTAAAGKWTSITFGIRADSEADPYGWKQFTHTVAMSTTYDWQPVVSSPSTSPGTTCGADDTVGLGDVMLYVKVSSPEGSNVGSLYPTIKVIKTSSGAVEQTTTNTAGLANGAPFAVRVPQDTLQTASANVPTEFTWTATVTDKTLTSSTLTCHFTFDPTIPGAPSITNCETTTGTIGKSVIFTISPNGAGSTPSGYHVQLNAAAPQSAEMGSSGSATATVIPTRGTNALTVTPYSAGGNIGQSATCVFAAGAPANAADADMTGDGIPDLVTSGGPGTGLPSGLWLAKGQSDASHTAGDGQVITSPVDIGIEGNGLAGDYKPSDFDGAQVITGLFEGNGLQDALVYYPSGYGSILDGNGDGSVLESEDASNTQKLDENAFTDDNGDNPMQIVNAYNADPDDNAAYPDLIARNGETNGYYLAYFQNGGAAGSWINGFDLTNTTPDGTMDWDKWTIATMTERSSGDMDMFLYDSATRALWLWQNFTVAQSSDGTSGTASYTAYELTSSWDPGTIASLHAADITGSGPAVWAVTTAATVTSWIVSGLPSAPAIAADVTQSLVAPTHEWRLGDATTGEATSAADTGSASTLLPLTGNSGTTWSGQDLFYPAVQFDGSTGEMTTTAQAVNTTGSYTVSAWVKPGNYGGAVLSETGDNTSCLALYITSTTDSSGDTIGQWNFGMTATDSATAPGWTLATSGSTVQAQPDIWSHITLTYDATDKYMELYVNGIPDVGASPSGSWSSGCDTFTLGQYTDGGQVHGHFLGKVADVQTWNSALAPVQIATLSGTPGYVLFPSDGHGYTSAASSTSWQWTTTHGEMAFYDGLIYIKETGTNNTTMTFGAAASSTAYLTLQADGNLVIYSGTGSNTALWSAGTQGNSGDVMFFQPDGNLVIYSTDGNPLWASDTDN